MKAPFIALVHHLEEMLQQVLIASFLELIQEKKRKFLVLGSRTISTFLYHPVKFKPMFILTFLAALSSSISVVVGPSVGRSVYLCEKVIFRVSNEIE